MRTPRIVSICGPLRRHWCVCVKPAMSARAHRDLSAGKRISHTRARLLPAAVTDKVTRASPSAQLPPEQHRMGVSAAPDSAQRGPARPTTTAMPRRRRMDQTFQSLRLLQLALSISRRVPSVTAGVDCACPFVHSVGLKRDGRRPTQLRNLLNSTLSSLTTNGAAGVRRFDPARSEPRLHAP
jgi:hypothetical protein